MPSSATCRYLLVETRMESGFVRDPGVQCKQYSYNGKRKEYQPDKLIEGDTSKGESFVQKWDWLFEMLWYAGHIFVMTTSMLSILTCLTRQVHKPWPLLLYRSTFVGVALTYTLSLLKTLNGAEPGFYSLLPLPTFQHIIVSIIWVFTIPHTIKLVPFALHSLLHVADTASEHHNTSKSRSRIAHGLSDNLAPKVLKLAGYLDIWLLIELFKDCLLIRPGAVISLLVYGFFFRVKLMFIPSSRDAAWHCYDCVDRYMSRPDCPRRIRKLWIRVRNRFRTEEQKNSDLYREDTEKAIEHFNMLHWNQ